ncbi:hypothetical protein HDU76_002495 [Blyttiomyces sp. JEL0837]|nr:hypothetical protein HDU76_002495 [Blyttiomyces sp. JEL0837]
MQVVVNESCLNTATTPSSPIDNNKVSTDFTTIINLIKIYIKSYSNILQHARLMDPDDTTYKSKLENLNSTSSRLPPVWTTPLDSPSSIQMKSQLLTISKNFAQAFDTVSKIPALNWIIHNPIDEDEDEEEPQQVMHPTQTPAIPNPLNLPHDLIIFYRWFSTDFDNLNKNLHKIMFFIRGAEISPLPKFDPTGQNKYYITLFNETPIPIRELNMETSKNEALWVNNNLYIRAISRIGDSDLSKSLVVYVKIGGSGEVFGMFELVEDGLTSFYPLAKSFSELMLKTSTMNACDEELWDSWVERHVQEAY